MLNHFAPILLVTLLAILFGLSTAAPTAILQRRDTNQTFPYLVAYSTITGNFTGFVTYVQNTTGETTVTGQFNTGFNDTNTTAYTFLILPSGIEVKFSYEILNNGTSAWTTVVPRFLNVAAGQSNTTNSTSGNPPPDNSTATNCTSGNPPDNSTATNYTSGNPPPDNSTATNCTSGNPPDNSNATNCTSGNPPDNSNATNSTSGNPPPDNSTATNSTSGNPPPDNSTATNGTGGNQFVIQHLGETVEVAVITIIGS